MKLVKMGVEESEAEEMVGEDLSDPVKTVPQALVASKVVAESGKEAADLAVGIPKILVVIVLWVLEPAKKRMVLGAEAEDFQAVAPKMMELQMKFAEEDKLAMSNYFRNLIMKIRNLLVVVEEGVLVVAEEVSVLEGEAED